MAQAPDPTDSELVLVAKHGSGPMVRSIAIVMLAERTGREHELQELLDG